MSLNHDILVVNDRMLDAQETLVALEQIAPRATVLHLESGSEALEYLFSVGTFAGRAPTLPRLVLLNAELGDISGLCLLDLMRAHPLTRAVPVVLLSLESDLQEHRRHDQFGADAYVLKPWDFQRYCTLLQGCLECWLPSVLRPSGSGRYPLPPAGRMPAAGGNFLHARAVLAASHENHNNRPGSAWD